MNQPPPDLGQAEGLLKLGDRIKFISILRLIAAAFALSLGWYVFEHRDTVMPALLANQLVIILCSLGALVIIAAPVVGWAINRSDNQNAALRALLEEQIEDAKQDLIDYKAENDAKMRVVNANEQRCQRSLARMSQALKDHGIEPPPNTGWGDLDGAPPR